MSVGIDGSGHICALDENGAIYITWLRNESEENKSTVADQKDLILQRLDGQAKKISFAGHSELWMLSAEDSTIFRRQWRESHGWDEQCMGKNVVEISGGSDGTLYAISKSGNVLRYNQQTRTLEDDEEWERLSKTVSTGSATRLRVARKASRVSCGNEGTVWVVDEDGTVFFKNSKKKQWECNSRWPVSVSNVSCGMDGSVWLICSGKRVVHGSCEIRDDGSADVVFVDSLASIPDSGAEEDIVEVHVGSASNVIAKTNNGRILQWVELVHTAGAEMAVLNWGWKELSALNNRMHGSTAASPRHSVGVGEVRFGVPSKPLVVAMVGLPARGKTYVAHKLMRYFLWLGVNCKVFNVGNYRRQLERADMPHTFFDPHNASGLRSREVLAEKTFEALTDFLKGQGGMVGIFDATNTTRLRRCHITRWCQDQSFQVVFLELVCTDMDLLEKNITLTKLRSPDYANVAPEQARDDFVKRMQHYEEAYESITDAEGVSYVKVQDIREKITSYRMEGFLQSRMVTMLMNSHICERKIYMSRHGESQYNVEGKVGGDSSLSERGQRYAQKLEEHVLANIPDHENLVIWTSVLKRTRETGARLFGFRKVATPLLNELDAGDMDGLTYEEIHAQYPEEFRKRSEDKFHYRYPGGESYEDICQRIEPIILEIERETRPVLVVGHQAVLRCLMCWFIGRNPRDAPYLNVPLHTLFTFSPLAYGCTETRFHIDVDNADADLSLE